MKSDLEKKLKDLSQKATPGPWDMYFATGESPAIITFSEIEGGFRNYKECVIPIFLRNNQDFFNYEFVAEANPQTILKLLELIEAYEEMIQDTPDNILEIKNRILGNV